MAWITARNGHHGLFFPLLLLAVASSLASTASQAAERQTETQPVPTTPVVNTSGQVTGTVVNTTA